jgi:D-inositol-3-phosphate glycosyltransferase
MPLKVTLLTGGSDRPYAFGLVKALVSMGLNVDFIGSDELISDEVLNHPQINFLNLRGDTSPAASRAKKIARICIYYLNLLHYSSKTDSKVFHILWANRFVMLDRILMNLYYRILGKKLLLTAHNVNQQQRDGHDNGYNRFTLRVYYGLMHHIFVHTDKMKEQLLTEFKVPAVKVSVIPFGINNTLPNTNLTKYEARKKLNLANDRKTILFFGRLAKYKGLRYAVEALERLSENDNSYHLIIAGRIEQGHESHWTEINNAIETKKLGHVIEKKIEHIPEEDVELYFKSADVLILPYKDIFQSGVLFLAYSFGLPVIASDVGSFREDILEGETGMICKPGNSDDLANTIRKYFESELFQKLETASAKIVAYGNKKYSWDEVGKITCGAYKKLSPL